MFWFLFEFVCTVGESGREWQESDYILNILKCFNTPERARGTWLNEKIKSIPKDKQLLKMLKGNYHTGVIFVSVSEVQM